jgi:uncharacterized protein YndB with AHSA1/START domain
MCNHLFAERARPTILRFGSSLAPEASGSGTTAVQPHGPCPASKMPYFDRVREPRPDQGRTDSASLVISARPDAIYRAFADPAALMKWLPPGNMTGRVLEYDFRESGHYRIELMYADDASSTAGKTSGRTDVTTGRFLSIDRGKRIVQSVEFESKDAAFAGEMIMTWTFEPVPTGTRVTVTAEKVPAGIGKADHDAGLRSSLENLARHLVTR